VPFPLAVLENARANYAILETLEKVLETFTLSCDYLHVTSSLSYYLDALARYIPSIG